ncbi:MAG TPA: TlpA family protein disulfide reductase [Clostridiaceae bacterium]|nr:TlpA family protein disulfide reductase [Clostridiaceae bacterium]
MKRNENVIIWIILFIVIMAAATLIYNKIKPDAIEKFPNSQKEDTLDKKDNLSDTDESDEGNAEEPEDNTSDSEKNSTKKDAPLAPDFTIEDMEGNKVSLSDFRGKYVFMNFWATWCGYCVQEMPDLDKAYKEMEKEGDAVIIAVNVQEELETVKKFIEEGNLSMPVLMDYKGEASRLYGIHVSGIPVTYVIDREGALYGRIIGATDYDTIMGVLEEIMKESEK